MEDSSRSRPSPIGCAEYIHSFVSAHADGELTAGERRIADDHIASCLSCRTRFAEERSLKALVRQHSNIMRVPAEVRLRIRAAIGEMAEPSPTARTSERRFGTFVRQARVWAPLAAAACLLVFLGVYSGHQMTETPATSFHAVPAFDLAISKYDSFARDFVPNVPTERDGTDLAWVMDRNNVEPRDEMRGEVGRSYAEADMPDDLYNFDAAGYVLDGGRVDRLADGRPATYTLYHREDRAILNIDLKNPQMSAPVGAVYWLGMRSFYRYKGYSFCVTFHQPGYVVSITLSREPLTELIRAVALSDVVATGSDR